MVKKEYIEREAARDYINNGDGTPLQKFFADLCVLNTPAADVEEVRHGRWIPDIRARKSADGYYYLWNSSPETVFVCSECGRVESRKEPYCHCGAKMDKEDN